MLDHLSSGISSNQTCKWGIEWDLCAPGLSCRFASERTLHFRWPPSANVGLDGVIYSDCVSNLLMYLGAESAVSSDHTGVQILRPNRLKWFRLRAPDLNVPGIASRSWNATDAAI